MSPIIIGIASAVLLAIIGIIICMDIPGELVKRRLEKKAAREAEKATVEETEDEKEKRTIAEQVDYYQGKKEFIVKREINTARSILEETGRGNEVKKTFVYCAICAIAGACIGYAIGNVFAIAILAAGLFMIPLWRLKLYRNKFRKYLAAQLESTTSMITTSYIRSSNIVEAVEENLEQLSPLVVPYFKDFVAESKVNPSTKNCVRDLRDRINDSIFKEWCETLLRTLDNSEMKEALLPICQKYSSVRVVQEEIDIEVTNSIMEYFVMLAMAIGCYPMVWFLNKEWFSYYSTFSGNIIVAYTLIVVFFAVAKLIAVMQPVQYKR